MANFDENIEVQGARVHNLKDIDVTIPREKLVVITGLSGSGKSSLAFDTIYAEGQRRYIETFSAYARQFLGGLERPDVDKIDGLSPVIAIEQKTTSKSPRSTVGTITEVYDFLRLLFARASDAFSYKTGEKMVSYSDEQIKDLIKKEFNGKVVGGHTLNALPLCRMLRVLIMGTTCMGSMARRTLRQPAQSGRSPSERKGIGSVANPLFEVHTG